MPLNETKPALTLHLPYLSAQSSLFIQTSLLYEWCGHALAVTAASPPICSKPIWPPVLPMSWPLSPSTLKCRSEAHGSCQLPLSSSGLSSYQWAAPRGSLLPLTPLPEPGLHYYYPPQHSGWLSVPPALYLLMCLHHKCDHAISCLSPSRSSPHLQGHAQRAPQVTGTVWPSSCHHSMGRPLTWPGHIQLLLTTGPSTDLTWPHPAPATTPWAVHWLDLATSSSCSPLHGPSTDLTWPLKPLVFPRWAHLSWHDTGRQTVPRKEQKPLHLEDTVQASPSPIFSSWVSKWNNSIIVALSPRTGLWLSTGKLLLVFLTSKFCTEMHRPWRQLAPWALGQREKLWGGSFDTRRESVSRK